MAQVTRALAVLAALIALWPAPGARGQETRVVAVAAIADAFAASSLDAFTTETGIALTLDAFPSHEALEAALARGRYDVATLSSGALARANEAGKLARLDAAAIPALSGLDPALTRLAPGGAPLLWSPYGFVYDARRARERLGERALDSWETALRPETLKAFADCRVALPDDPAAMVAAAALALKLDPASRRGPDLRRALDRLLLARGVARIFTAPAAIGSDLAAGDLCLAVMTAGDAAQARSRALAAGEDAEIVFSQPREGAPAIVDALAILKDAPHPMEAAAFVDFALRPDTLARATARTRFSNAVPASRTKIAPDLAREATLYPDPAAAAKMFAPAPMDAQASALVARDWARIKSGK